MYCSHFSGSGQISGSFKIFSRTRYRSRHSCFNKVILVTPVMLRKHSRTHRPAVIMCSILSCLIYSAGALELPWNFDAMRCNAMRFDSVTHKGCDFKDDCRTYFIPFHFVKLCGLELTDYIYVFDITCKCEQGLYKT